MSFEDIWQWSSVVVLWICGHSNQIMALILFFLNATWLVIRIFSWIKGYRKDSL